MSMLLYTRLHEDDLIRESKQVGEKLKDFTFTNLCVRCWLPWWFIKPVRWLRRRSDGRTQNIRPCLYL